MECGQMLKQILLCGWMQASLKPLLLSIKYNLLHLTSKLTSSSLSLLVSCLQFTILQPTSDCLPSVYYYLLTVLILLVFSAAYLLQSPSTTASCLPLQMSFCALAWTFKFVTLMENQTLKLTCYLASFSISFHIGFLVPASAFLIHHKICCWCDGGSAFRYTGWTVFSFENCSPTNVSCCPCS